MEGVFAGGDFVTGPDMVIEAIAAGRRGAMAIEKYLTGDVTPVRMYDTRADEVEQPPPPVEKEGDGEWEEKPRLEVPVLATEQRKQSFEEIEIGFTEEHAVEEAKRCLRCDLEIV